jgi:hypothetical protein
MREQHGIPDWKNNNPVAFRAAFALVCGAPSRFPDWHERACGTIFLQQVLRIFILLFHERPP